MSKKARRKNKSGGDEELRAHIIGVFFRAMLLHPEDTIAISAEDYANLLEISLPRIQRELDWMVQQHGFVKVETEDGKIAYTIPPDDYPGVLEGLKEQMQDDDEEELILTPEQASTILNELREAVAQARREYPACPKCKTDLLNSVWFCRGCDIEISPLYVCPSCHWLHCQHCHERIAELPEDLAEKAIVAMVETETMFYAPHISAREVASSTLH